MDVHGTVAEGFEPVRDAFVRNFERLGEQGAAVAVYRDGRKVVDLWAGTRDVDGARALGAWTPRRSSAPRPRASPPPYRCCCTSAASSTWTRRWARTGRSSRRRGKERVLVRHARPPRRAAGAGPARSPPPRRWTASGAPTAVAAQAPVWEPGTEHGYHAQTYGWLLGELVRRVTGRAHRRWVADGDRRPARPGPVDRAARTSEAAPGRPDRPRRGAGAAERGALRAARPSARSPRPTTTRPRSPAAPSPRSTPLPDENDPAYRAAELPADQRHRHGARAGPLLRRADRRGRRRYAAVRARRR